MSRTVIIGAGVIGLSCAYELAARGQEVVLIDPAEPGSGCSRGNMGWVTPSLADPVPSPDILGTSMLWALTPGSPLHIRPQTLPRLLPWFLAFVRHCNTRDFERGLYHVAELSVISRRRYDELKEAGLQFELHPAGLLFVFTDAKSLEHKLHTLEWTERLHYKAPRVFDRDELLAFEPALSPELHAGIFVEEEAHVRPESVSAGLYAQLQRTKARFVTGRVTGWRRAGGRLAAAVVDGREEVAGDQFVVAGGARSGEIVRELGIKLPMQAGKGYSITLSQPAVELKRPIYVNEARIAISPFDGALRVGGFMEFSGINETLYPHRVRALKTGAARFFKGPFTGRSEEAWTGMRPLTPDGLPVIGRTRRFDNLLLATAHAMMGVTLAPVTGTIIAELITAGRTAIDIAPSDPDRFG